MRFQLPVVLRPSDNGGSRLPGATVVGVNRILPLGVALLVLGSLGACSKNSSPAVSASSSSTTAAPSASSGAKAVTLTAKNFAFDQTSLTGTAGEKVTFVLHNADGTKHNLTIKDLGVNEDVVPGQDSKAVIVTLKSGTFEFHCEYHPQKMTGTLTVS
jgi:cytochrome c oxidase subunit 2